MDKVVECTFGKKCYRQNPTHFVYNTHQHLAELISLVDEDDIVIPEDYDSPISRTILSNQVKIVLSLRRKAGGSSSTSAQPQQPREPDGQPPRKKTRQESLAASAAGAGSSQPGYEPPGTSNKPKPPSKQDFGDMALRWEAAAPFHFFLTRIVDSPRTHAEDLGINFLDLYDLSLGELEASLQINFMIDIHFVMPHIITAGCYYKPLLMLYETCNATQSKLPDHIKHIQVKPKAAFGHHHTKMSMMYYKDKSVRVVVSTANLITDDWKNYTQGVWMSPACPKLSESGATGESPSGFKASLRAYLASYQLPDLAEWIERVKQADFSQVKVCLVASAPSSGPEGQHRWGLGRLRTLLRQHVPSGTTSPEWPAVVQCSSLGSLGATPSEWLEGQMKAAMLGTVSTAPTPRTPLQLIYPSLADVKGSHDGLAGGGCLPYGRATHIKQLWLQEFMHRWRSERRHRTRATPHIKTYCRVSPDGQKLAWFLLTSANLSKAAWGRSTHQGQGQNIMSYEAGVLFLPKLLTGQNVFEVSHQGQPEGEKLPVPYDLPLTRYAESDKPWVAEYLSSSSSS